MIDEFKKVLMRGNVVDLAVAVVIGAAFGAVVTSVVDNLVTPLLGLFGNKDFSQYVLTLRDASGDDPGVAIGWGAILTALINFVLIAAAIFFLIVKPLNVLAERRKRGQVEEEDAPPTEAELLTEIRDLLARQPGGPGR